MTAITVRAPLFKDAGSTVSGSYRQILLDSRKSQLRLTVANVRRLEKTFDAAIQSIVSRVAALPEVRQGTEWHRAQLNLIASIRTTMDALRKDYDTLLEAGMTELAQTAAQRQIATGALVDAAPDKSLFPDLSRTFPLSDGSSVIVEFGQLAVDAVERAANRYYRDGLKLSDRLYTMNARGRRDIENTIIQGLTEQVSARDLARRLEKNLLEAGSANVRYDASRIARTELNQAHREAAVLSATTGDGVTLKNYISGIRWNLSASHPAADFCDILAGYDGGLGSGVYLPQDYPSSHPHCLCFTTDLLVNFPESGIGGRKPDMANVPASQIRYYAGQGDPVARAVLAGG